MYRVEVGSVDGEWYTVDKLKGEGPNQTDQETCKKEAEDLRKECRGNKFADFQDAVFFICYTLSSLSSPKNASLLCNPDTCT